MTDDDVVETSELLRRAWEAVERSGVPESMQQAAFREAVEDIRGGGAPAPAATGGTAQSPGKAKRRRSPSSTDAAMAAGARSDPAIDEATFFAQLSHESGVDENDLRDVISLSGETVHVTPPTRQLGSNTADQAKTVIPLVAGARSFGLGERPVNSKAVRAELDRKGCYQPRKFSERHLGPLRGFNAGASPAEIVTTSRWVDEFKAAVDRALGRTTEDAEK
jgi:hypothetical protein